MVEPLTVSQALKLTSGKTVYVIGEYNADGTAMRFKVNGKVKTWKRQPGIFQVPIKRGLYEYGYIDQDNFGAFSLEEPPRVAKMSISRRNVRPKARK